MTSEHHHTISNTLDLLTDTYNYNHWIYSLLRPHLGERVLEVGAGIGNITQFLLGCQQVVTIDIEEKYAAALAETSKVHRNLVSINRGVLDIPCETVPEDSFDTVLCINVLEHVEDDLRAIQAMLSVLKPWGKLFLYVPACHWAYGTLDKELGHHRRYSKQSLKALASSANARLVQLHFVNFVGIFGWFWAARIRKDDVIRRENAWLMDKMVPYIFALESFIKPPFGQSLVSVMEKTANE